MKPEFDLPYPPEFALKVPHHSASAIAAHPAPVRERYFNSRDYALACMRVHERRLKFDNFKPVKHRKKS